MIPSKLLFVLILSTLLPLLATQPVNGLQYLNVGGTGTYGQVTNMVPNDGVWNQCPATYSDSPAVCTKAPYYVGSSLAPFDEDFTVALRGPMTVENVGVYYPSGTGWSRVSYWDSTNVGTTNLDWMNNAGAWSICHGSGQSYMSVDGLGSASSPQRFSGVLGNDVNVNLMSDVDCTPTLCPGFIRGVGKQGWSGNECGEKMFAIKVLMPHDTTGSNNNDMPAIWLLNGQIVRANQWGCNCRVMGSDGGCGELDIAEILQTGSEQCTSTLYSFKQSLGTPAYFQRPTSVPTTFVVVFDARGTGTISILSVNSFPFASVSIPQSVVQSWITNANPTPIVFDQPYTGTSCSQLTSLVGAETENTAEAVDGNLSTSASIGIGVAVVVLVVVLVVGVVVLVKRRRAGSLQEVV